MLAGECSVGYRNARLYDGVAHSRSLLPTTAKWDIVLPTTVGENAGRDAAHLPSPSCSYVEIEIAKSYCAACRVQPYNEGGITMPRPQAIQRRTGCHRAHHEGCRTYAEGVRYLPPATTAYHADWDTDVKSSAIVSRVISAWSNAARLRTAPRRGRVAAAARVALRCNGSRRGARGAPVVDARARRRAVRQRDRLIPVGKSVRPETSEHGNFRRRKLPKPESSDTRTNFLGAVLRRRSGGRSQSRAAQRSVDSAGLSTARVYFSRQ